MSSPWVWSLHPKSRKVRPANGHQVKSVKSNGELRGFQKTRAFLPYSSHLSYYSRIVYLISSLVKCALVYLCISLNINFVADIALGSEDWRNEQDSLFSESPQASRTDRMRSVWCGSAKQRSSAGKAKWPRPGYGGSRFQDNLQVSWLLRTESVLSEEQDHGKQCLEGNQSV